MEIANLQFGYKNRDMLTEFAGYDHNKRIADSAFYDMQNLSGRYRPCLAPRERRGKVSTAYMHTCRGMIAKDNLFWIDDDGTNAKFYKDNTEITAVTQKLAQVSSGVTHDTERQLVSMGAYIVIFPDKVMYNTKAEGNDEAVVTLEKNVTAVGELINDEISIQVTREDGSTYLRWKDVNDNLFEWNGDPARNTFIQAKTPTKADKTVTSEVDGETVTTELELDSGDYWIDTSGDKSFLKVYNESTGLWSPVATTFVKISHASLADGEKPMFKANDAVTISGFPAQYEQFNTTVIVSSSGVDNGVGWIVITGLVTSVEDTVPTQGQTIQFRMLCPEMDFICESKNRIWGCHYGRKNDGSIVNEIYACALGDPTNWYRFAGTAADSYQVSVGTDGDFTGIAAYDDQILFFKEKYIHKIFGTKPSNFQSTFATTSGIRAGSAASAVIINETLYYLSKNGVMAYSGGTPVSLHAPFGGQRFTDGVAGGIGDKYYICMTNQDTGERCLWCFDITHQLWFKEDSVDIDRFATLKENIFVAGAGELAVLNGETYDYTGLALESREKAVEWFAETGDIGLVTDDEKYYSDFQIRFECEAGSEIHIAFKYDDSENWTERFAVRNDRRRAFNIPFVSPRCDHMRIKFFGRGKVIVYSISKYYEGGGEVTRG